MYFLVIHSSDFIALSSCVYFLPCILLYGVTRRWEDQHMDKLNSLIPFFRVQEDFLIHVPRQRTKTKRFGDMDEILDLTSDDSDEETKTKPPPAASNKKPKEKREPSQRPPKKQVQCGWTRLECFRVEKGLLTFGWATYIDLMPMTSYSAL